MMDLNKAIFDGSVDKVQRLIEANENVYKTTVADDSILFLAIALEHTTIANLLIDILERDLEVLKRFFENHKIPNNFWLNEATYIIYGSEHIRLVKEITGNLLVDNPADMLNNNTKGLILMLKPSNLCDAEVLWLQTKHLEDVKKIAQVIQSVFDDGTIDVMKTEQELTLLEVAVERYNTDVFFRLLKLYGAECLSDLKCLQYLTYICTKLNPTNADEYFKDLYAQAANIMPLREITDVILTPGGTNLLMIPIKYGVFDLFEYFLHSVANHEIAKQNISQDQAISLVFNTLKTPTINIFKRIIWCENYDFTLKCLKFNPDLLKIIANETLMEIISRLRPNKLISDWIVEFFEEISLKGLADKVIKTLIEFNWVEAVRRLYEVHPTSKKTLFMDYKKGMDLLIHGINEYHYKPGIEQCHYELVEFLVNAHGSDLTDPGDLLVLISYSVRARRGFRILKSLLSLPDVNVMFRDENNHRSIFYEALESNNLESYRELLHCVKDLKDLIGKF